MADTNSMPESPASVDSRNRIDMAGQMETPEWEKPLDASGRKGGTVMAAPRMDDNPAIRVFENTQRLTQRGSSSVWAALVVALVVVAIILFAAARYMGPQALPPIANDTAAAAAHNGSGAAHTGP